MGKNVFVFVLSMMCLVNSQKDLSRDGTATQKSTFLGLYPANLAIIGGPTNDWSSGSCATTAGNTILETSTYWRLTFINAVYFTDIQIWYRDITPYRLAGYYLYVSNTTSMANAYLCYHDEGPDLPSVNQTVECNHLGKHIIIYNERNPGVTYPSSYSTYAWLELCDVQVYGCYKSWYGNDCEMRCSEKCFSQHCYPGNGSCVWGCNCLNKNCDNSTTCTEGCEKRFAGQYCNEYNLASDGLASQHPSPGNLQARHAIDGDRTEQSCSNTFGRRAWWQVDLGELTGIKAVYLTFRTNGKQYARDHSVYITTTSRNLSSKSKLNMTTDFDTSFPFLTYTVNPVILGRYLTYVPVQQNNGFATVDICEVEVVGCPSRRYGRDCNQTCPENCFGSCHPDDGTCSFGCNDGWTGLLCDEKCGPNKFGKNCVNTCYCATGTCSYMNGTCPPGGCQAGWEGTTCSSECSAGTFGFNCNETCNGCSMNSCNRTNGLCTNGCKPGWKPDNVFCNIACDDGYYGDCLTKCYCLDGVCDKSTGFCKDRRCAHGWKGDTCSQECDPGTHGVNCGSRCVTCLNTTCERFEGNCTVGCIAGYKGLRCEINVDKLTGESPIGGIVGGIVSAIVVVIVMLVILLVFRHKLSKKREDETIILRASKETLNSDSIIITKESTTTHDLPSKEDMKNGKSDLNKQNNMYGKPEYEKQALYENATSDEDSQKYKIQIKDLQSAILEKHKNANAGFKEEYERLPSGLVRPHTEGSKSENKKKNRFLSTWPYDHSRVVLQGNNNSDYINASYIDSYSKEKAYIATQGPKKSTLKDFWHMVWQEKVAVIVMVTNLEEEGKKKCEKYWPETSLKPLILGEYKISMQKEKKRTNCIYRKLMLLDKTDKTDRTVHHFHFTKWPDHGVPDKIKLISFYRFVRRTKTTLNCPMIVHCSAGIGRTGTFIAIDALYENGTKTDYVNTMEYVQKMRKDRMNMIQTLEQYIAVFEALLEIFSVPDTAINRNDVCDYVNNLQSNEKNQNNLRLEFKNLQNLKPSYGSTSFRAAKLPDNTAKNVVQNILPHDKYRPYLMSYGKGSNDYINAVIIPKYTDNENILVSQYPLKDTVVDFWTMVYDNDCTGVVLLEQVSENVSLWPNNDDVFDFEKLNVKQSGNSSVILNHKENSDSRTISIITMDEWNSEHVPSSEMCMLDVLHKVSNHTKHHSGSVAVVCQDGCRRSGVFVALSLIFEKLEMDDEVDIFQIVRSIQIRRPEFLSNFDQYEFCYHCVKKHLGESDSLYANT